MKYLIMELMMTVMLLKSSIGNGYIDDIYGWNFNDNTNDISDYIGHGTHTAGL